jgi:hypothetical protein
MTRALADQVLRLSPEQRREFLSRAGLEPPVAAPAAPAAGPALASPGQEALWLQWRLAPGSPDYNVPHGYILTGPLDADALAAALDDVVARHEPLRTVFAEDAAGLVQVVGDAEPGLLRRAAADSLGAALRAARELAECPFDLATGPLIRARLWRFAPDRHLLAIVCHHVIVDERSSRILESELAEHYRARRQGVPAGVPALPERYADVVAAQRGQDQGADLAYWRQQLAGPAGTELVPDLPRPPVRGTAGQTHELVLIGAAARAVAELAEGRGITPFMAAAAGFAVFLARRTGRLDVTFGTPVSGREHPGADVLIGYFLNLVALRVRIDPAWSYDQLAGEIRETVSDASRHSGAPFQNVVRALRAATPPGRGPLFDVAFVHLSAAQAGGPPAGQAAWAGGVAVLPVHLAAAGASFDLTVAMIEAPGRTLLALRYATQLYRHATIESWAADLAEVYVRLASRPSAPLADLIPAARPSRPAGALR